MECLWVFRPCKQLPCFETAPFHEVNLPVSIFSTSLGYNCASVNSMALARRVLVEMHALKVATLTVLRPAYMKLGRTPADLGLNLEIVPIMTMDG